MNEQQLLLILQDPLFWSWLSQLTGLSEELCQLMVAQMLLSGDQLAQLQFILIVQQYVLAIQGAQAQIARFGMKLNHLKTLKGNCPTGSKLMYYKSGGRICKKCVKKRGDGGEMDNRNPIKEFKDEHNIRYPKPTNPIKKNDNGGPLSDGNNTRYPYPIKPVDTTHYPNPTNPIEKDYEGGPINEETLQLGKLLVKFFESVAAPIAKKMLRYADSLVGPYKERFYDFINKKRHRIKTEKDLDQHIKKFLDNEDLHVLRINDKEQELDELYNSGRISEDEYNERMYNIEDRASQYGYQEGGVIKGQDGLNKKLLIENLSKLLPTHPVHTIREIINKIGITGDTGAIGKAFGKDIEGIVKKILKLVSKKSPENKSPILNLPYSPKEPIGSEPPILNLPYSPKDLPDYESPIQTLPYTPKEPIPNQSPEYKLYRNGGEISTIDRIKTAIRYKNGGMIKKYDGGGFFDSIKNIITAPIRTIQDIWNRIKNVLIGPNGEVKIIEVPVTEEVIPDGWRRPTQEEAKRVMTQFLDNTKPVYDEATGAYISPHQLARRVISEYEYAPNDTTIYVSPWANTSPTTPSRAFTNNSVDLDRRIFEALNLQFEPTVVTSTPAPTRRSSGRSSRGSNNNSHSNDTINVRIVDIPQRPDTDIAR